VAYWSSDAFAVSNWLISSSLLAVGLSRKIAPVAVKLGNFLAALVVTFNGFIGARLDISFTVCALNAPIRSNKNRDNDARAKQEAPMTSTSPT
jgi:NCS1 family nucleobase:cation symporter-1